MNSSSGAGFLDPTYLRELGGARFPSAVVRLLFHLGFADAWNIDGANDAGADVIAEYGSDRWVWQCKWKKDVTAAISSDAVAEVAGARGTYGADRAAVITNGQIPNSVRRAAEQYPFRIDLIGAPELRRLWDDKLFLSRLPETTLRHYQRDAVNAALAKLEANGRALVVMATGLGKTVVMGSVIDSYLRAKSDSKVLVVAHMQNLVEQLEKASWRFLDRHTPTHFIAMGHYPDELNGVTCATIQGATRYVESGFRPNLIIIDESHHVGADNKLAELLKTLEDVPQLGLTATPWRGDGFDLENWFGRPAFTLSITEGMKFGYLAEVDYRLFADTVSWDEVEKLSHESYGINDLNHKLFLPQRDERIRDELIAVWDRTPKPRAIVFCQTIEHAERFRDVLSRVPQFQGVSALHGKQPMRERQKTLLKFRSGAIPVLVAVDVLNEGIDIPDVNIVCFARVTHSRKIFVQQLGRGLRIARGKSSVKVLDFVSDLRRVAAALDMRRSLTGESEEIYLANPHRIEFVNAEVGALMSEWIKDAAEIEDSDGSSVLAFPDL